MRIPRSNKGRTTHRRSGRVLALAVLLGGCAAEPQASSTPGSRARAQLEAAVSEPLDFGQDWDSKRATLADPLSGDGGGLQEPKGPVWGIVLRTFSTPNHQQAAATMVGDLPRISAQLGSAWIDPRESGSIVAYGRYSGPDDPAAQSDLEWIKGIEINGQRVFPRAMLTRLQRGGGSASMPYQLMSVRRKYPNIDPLYTLQVAVWGSFGGAMPWEKAQRNAEDHVRRLRAEGLPAYVHHDPNAQLSMVTVGLYDRRALNPRSGLFSDEVEVMMQRFDEHLVNGQPVTNPATGETQQPNLVLVPKR